MTTVWTVHVTDPWEYGSGWIEGVYSSRDAAEQHVTHRGHGETSIEQWEIRDAFDPTRE